MVKRILFLISCGALAASLHAASPAATQAWVSNYVDRAIQDAGVTPTELPTNVVSGTIDVAAGTLSFTYEGETYTVGIAVTNEVADVDAFKVCESTDASSVPTGTVFVLDESTGRYANHTLSFPNDLALTITNGCCKLYQSNGVWRAVSSGTTNTVEVIVESNRVYRSSFTAYRTLVTPTEARRAGVTNAPAVAWGPVRKTALEFVLELICGSAHAATANAPASESFSFVYTLTLKDGSTRDGSILFTYSGLYYDWNTNPGEGCPVADVDNHYVPNWWPHSPDWNASDNWKSEKESDGKIVITSYIKKGGVYTPVEVAVTRSKLADLTGKSLSAFIPAFRPPAYVEIIHYDCAHGYHYWVNCVCIRENCGKIRKHSLAAGEAGTCDRCTNLNGTDQEPGEVCGSSCQVGTNRSAKKHHHGWYDSDGIEKNEMACTCECYGKDNCVGWRIVHDPDGEKFDIGEGYREEDGSVSEESKKTYHHYSTECQRATGVEDEVCGAPVNHNEVHDFRAADGSQPVPFIGDPADPDNVKLAHGEQSEEANELKHYCGDMTCSVCQRKASDYDSHAFEQGSCICTGCGLALHAVSEITGERDGGYLCGSKIVPGCNNCNTYSETGDPVVGRISNLTEALHFKTGEDKDGIFVNESCHICPCGRVTAPHCMREEGDDHWVCAFCPYEYDGYEPPCGPGRDYVVGGYCGHWKTRLGEELPGGSQYELADGTSETFPSGHNFGAVEGALCYRCTNTNPLTKKPCNRHDTENISIHGGWHHTTLVASNETTHTVGHCTCDCGVFNRDHEIDTEDEYHYETGPSNTCVKVGYCKHIGPCAGDTPCHTVVSNEVEHSLHDFAGATGTPNGETNHTVEVKCRHELDSGETGHAGCNMITNVVEKHTYTNAAWIGVSETNHAPVVMCLKCYYVTTNMLAAANHTPLTPTNAVARKSGSVPYHKLVYRCSVCKERWTPPDSWAATAETCEAEDGDTDYVLGDSFSVGDTLACFRADIGCTNRIDCGHDYGSDDTTHWCKRGGRHLTGKHTVSTRPIEFTCGDLSMMVSVGRCAVCGRLIGADEETQSPYGTCEKCSCIPPTAMDQFRYCVVSNGMTFVSAWFDREPTGKTRCRYWDEGLRQCMCRKCHPLSGVPVPALCECEYRGDGYLYFCDAIIGISAHKGEWFMNAGIYAADGSDPVYEILSSGFEHAFACCPNLRSVSFPFTTNMAAAAFRDAFTNCTSLSRVNFESLANAGDSSFERAFAGCGALSEISFPSLASVGEAAFNGAFSRSGVRVLSLPVLRSALSYSLSFGEDNCIERLTIPRLDDSSGIDFARLPKLEVLDLSAITSNGLVHVGNMSPLASVKQIRFCLADEVLPFYDEDGNEHLVPDNNSNFVWVVPDSLLDEWRAAPGWSAYSRHVVPESNPVMTDTIIFGPRFGPYFGSGN